MDYGKVLLMKADELNGRVRALESGGGAVLATKQETLPFLGSVATELTLCAPRAGDVVCAVRVQCNHLRAANGLITVEMDGVEVFREAIDFFAGNHAYNAYFMATLKPRFAHAFVVNVAGDAAFQSTLKRVDVVVNL